MNYEEAIQSEIKKLDMLSEDTILKEYHRKIGDELNHKVQDQYEILRRMTTQELKPIVESIRNKQEEEIFKPIIGSFNLDESKPSEPEDYIWVKALAITGTIFGALGLILHLWIVLH